MDWSSGRRLAGGELTRSGVTAPSAGEITTRGPVHLDRRATTSARSVKSAKATFGWDLSWRQASFVGIVPEAVGLTELDKDDVPSCFSVRKAESLQWSAIPHGASE